MPSHEHDPHGAPPMKPNTFHILLSLADGDQHGYGIMQEVLERTEGRVRLWPATLYGTLRRLMEEGLIQEIEERQVSATADTRRRYYRLSPEGRTALMAEIARLEDLMRAVRAKRRSLNTEPA